MQENQRLKKDIEDLNAHITVLTQADQQHQSAIDNSETFNTWNDKKDSNRINIDVSNLGTFVTQMLSIPRFLLIPPPLFQTSKRILRVRQVVWLLKTSKLP